MPLFEYQCQACGKDFEVFTQRRDPSALPKCPECGTADVERIFSAFSAPSSVVGGCGAPGSAFG
jgi:putative FmdB family regulatory protein